MRTGNSLPKNWINFFSGPMVDLWLVSCNPTHMGVLAQELNIVIIFLTHLYLKAVKQKTSSLYKKVTKMQCSRLYDGSKKSGSKIAVEESSSGRRLRSKILRPRSSNVVFVICSIIHTDGLAQTSRSREAWEQKQWDKPKYHEANPETANFVGKHLKHNNFVFLRTVNFIFCNFIIFLGFRV